MFLLFFSVVCRKMYIIYILVVVDDYDFIECVFFMFIEVGFFWDF